MTRRRRTALLAGLLALLVAPLGTAGPVPAVSRAPAAGVGEPRGVTLLQMNLCLSGLGDCYEGTAYPAVVEEAVDRIRDAAADAVVLAEACSGDAERIARATGLHVTFSTVIYGGAPLACRDPGGRGLFGNAVLTARVPVAVRDTAYADQADLEERRLACVLTARLTVCATHLSTRSWPDAQTVNDAQCAELAALLARPTGDRPTVASGDMNRQAGCAPSGWRTVTDAAATRNPGVQHAYLDPRLASITWEVEPMAHSDHDALLLRFAPTDAPEP